MRSFLLRFGSLILSVLSGFDRLRFRGDSRLLNHAGGVESYLWQRQLPRKQFADHALHLTRRLRRETEALAQAEGVPLQPLNSPNLDKEAAALALAQRHRRHTGRIAVLSCVESCQTYRIRKGSDGLFQVRKESGKCLHYYHYFQHEQLGLCYVRLQSWFPFTVHVGLNGRHWLYQQLQRHGIGFRHHDNLLVDVEDWGQAQALLDEQLRTDWPTLLNQLVEPLQPLWPYLHDARVPYYWMTEQSEWATDVLFHDPAALQELYPRWLRHGIEVLNCKDVLRYLGQRVPRQDCGRCTGDVNMSLRHRLEGARLKLWYRGNSLKLYDKAGQALRVETTINQPSHFKVYRSAEGAPAGAPQAWQQMRKGVADLHRRAEVSQRSNERLLESLATTATPQPLGKLLEPLSRPVLHDGKRRARALNPLAGPDGELLRVIASGEFLINGFRNRDLRLALCPPAANKLEERRQAARITRQLTLLRAHGLIVKIAHTHRYQLSAQGRRIATALRAAYTSDVTKLAACA
jgi:hypothetical protein